MGRGALNSLDNDTWQHLRQEIFAMPHRLAADGLDRYITACNTILKQPNLPQELQDNVIHLLRGAISFENEIYDPQADRPLYESESIGAGTAYIVRTLPLLKQAIRNACKKKLMNYDHGQNLLKLEDEWSQEAYVHMTELSKTVIERLNTPKDHPILAVAQWISEFDHTGRIIGHHPLLGLMSLNEESLPPHPNKFFTQSLQDPESKMLNVPLALYLSNFLVTNEYSYAYQVMQNRLNHILAEHQECLPPMLWRTPSQDNSLDPQG